MKRLLPQNHKGVWYLIRRVPQAYAHLDNRKFAKLTTGIRVSDDPRGSRAARVVLDLNAQLEQDWADLVAGRDPKAQRDFDRAQRLASDLGLSYRPAADVAGEPLEEILRRLEMLERLKAGDDRQVVDAALGGMERPVMLISQLAEAYEEEQAASLKDMSKAQIKRWRGNKKRAVRNMLAVVEDKPVTKLTREDAIAFRKHFQRRVLEEGFAINSANIEMSHLTGMLRVIETERHLGIPLAAFTQLAISGGKRKQRPAFETDYIQDALLAEDALAGLDPEARRVLYVMADTGMRPSEIVGLLPKHIHLNAPVPYVSIRGEGKRLKNEPSERDMPLVGCALAAMRLQPKGFPKYRDRGDDLSTEINDYLTKQDLRPTPEHSLYGLRHSFEDRLTALDMPDKIIGRLMGHKGYREKYGNGPSLEHLQSWLNRIAFIPPASM